MSRTADRAGLPDETWKRLVERDLDDHDDDIEAFRGALDELKETNKWVLRTMIGLLISLLIVMAGLVGTVLQ